MKKLPNFLIIGSMKCGTTSLAHYLSQHKEIFISKPPQIYFFCDDEKYNKGRDYYETYFSNTHNAKAIGEASDDYTKGIYGKSEKAATRIREMLPECKLIFIAKHPLQQIESSWLQRVANSSEKLPFNEAVLHSHFGYVDTANYKKQLKHYLDLFPKDQIKVFFTEDLASDPENTLSSCLSFLEVTPTLEDIDLTRKNVSLDKQYDRSLTKKLRMFEVINQIAKSTPSGLKRILKKGFTKKLTEKPKWNQETLNHVFEIIKSDSEDFLEQYKKPKTFWNLTNYGR